jgi:phospholipase C
MESVATGRGPSGPNIVAGRGCRLVRSPTRPSRLLGRLIVVAAAAAAGFLSLSGAPPPPTASISAPRPAAPNGIDTIEHVIIAVQENRSFDHDFGTYPGADGLPRNRDGSWAVCLSDPKLGRCSPPYHSTGSFDAGGAHTQEASRRDVNGGQMNGFVRTVRRSGSTCVWHPNDRRCTKLRHGPSGQPDVMGFHTRAEIPTTGRTRIGSSCRIACSHRPTRGRCPRICTSSRRGRPIACCSTTR